MKKIFITFNSPFMKNDTITITGDTTEEAKEKFIEWWKGYGKNEEEAMETVIFAEDITDGTN